MHLRNKINNKNSKKEGLIDEFYLFVNPVALGRDESIFGQIKNIQQLKLKKSIAYPCGIVSLHYNAN